MSRTKSPVQTSLMSSEVPPIAFQVFLCYNSSKSEASPEFLPSGLVQRLVGLDEHLAWLWPWQEAQFLEPFETRLGTKVDTVQF